MDPTESTQLDPFGHFIARLPLVALVTVLIDWKSVAQLEQNDPTVGSISIIDFGDCSSKCPAIPRSVPDSDGSIPSPNESQVDRGLEPFLREYHPLAIFVIKITVISHKKVTKMNARENDKNNPPYRNNSQRIILTI